MGHIQSPTGINNVCTEKTLPFLATGHQSWYYLICISIKFYLQFLLMVKAIYIYSVDVYIKNMKEEAIVNLFIDRFGLIAHFSFCSSFNPSTTLYLKCNIYFIWECTYFPYQSQVNSTVGITDISSEGYLEFQYCTVNANILLEAVTSESKVTSPIFLSA